MLQPLKCKQGGFKSLVIDGRGTISWKGQGEYVPDSRICGKKKKYIQVQLMRSGTLKWFYLHRLMAYSWLGPSPHLLRIIVDHQDGDSFNNQVENLRWVTPTANQLNKACRGMVEEGALFYP